MIDAEAIKEALRCGRSGCACSHGPNVHCPNHDDKKPSFTVHEKDGAVLFNCKTGCSQKAVVEALKDRGLWTVHEIRGPTQDGRRGSDETKPTVEYEYRDMAGLVVAIKGRFEKGSDKTFRWRLAGKTAWTLEGKSIAEFALWGSEKLRALPGERVFFVEGEKAAQACHEAGLLAVTHSGGAGTKDFGRSLEVLRGRDVVLWPDNDEAGRKHMDQVRAALRGIARSTVTIFPILPEKGDAFEFFGDGRTAADLIAILPTPPRPVLEYLETEDDEGCRFAPCGLGYSGQFGSVKLTVEQLRWSSGELRGAVLVECAIPAMPRHLYWGSLILSSGANREKLAKTLEGRTPGLGLEWDSILEVYCRKVGLAARQGEPFTTVGDMDIQHSLTDWAITGFAARLEPTTIWGDGGVGKSMLSLALGLSIRVGMEIVPGFAPIIRGNVLYLDWEASKQRLDSRIKRLCAGAGISPVVLGYRRCQMALAHQVEDVLRYCQSEGVVLVIVDSAEMAMNGTGGGENSNPNDRVVLLHSALRLLGTTTIVIDHVNAVGRSLKGLAGKPTGGVAKTNLARLAFELKKGQRALSGHEQSLGLFNVKRNDDGPLLDPVGLKVHFDGGSTYYQREGISDTDLLSGMSNREAMVSALKEWGPMTIKELADQSGVKRSSVDAELSKNKGELFEKSGAGLWKLIPNETLDESTELPF